MNLLLSLRKHALKSLLLAMIMILQLPVRLPILAQGEVTLTAQKPAFEYGEGVKLDYTGTSLKDWIGIYYAGQTPGSEASLVWQYTEISGQPDGTADFTKGVGAAIDELAPGNYTAFLCKDDGYEVLAQASFEVLAPTAVPDAPKAVTYTRSTEVPGYAEGEVRIMASGYSKGITHYILYWGDKNGKLSGYVAIDEVQKVGSVTLYKFEKNVIIPEEATRILVYSVNVNLPSETFTEAALPEGVNAKIKGKLLYSFNVISDIHITTNPESENNLHFAPALQDIKEVSPNSAAIIINGDIADSAKEEEYQIMNKIIDKNKQNLPTFYFVPGNHDFSTGNFEQDLSLFEKYTGANGNYSDFWLNSYHYIYLGSDGSGPNDATISEKQLAWFEAKLKENYVKGNPIFVMLHQPLKDTVAGSIGKQGWNGVIPDNTVRALVDKYPEIVMFTGHTHWEMQSKQNAFFDKASFFNTSAVAYLWTDDDEYKKGSQGYFIYVYKDKLVVRGRDFEAKAWIPAAQYIVPLPKE